MECRRVPPAPHDWLASPLASLPTPLVSFEVPRAGAPPHLHQSELSHPHTPRVESPKAKDEKRGQIVRREGKGEEATISLLQLSLKTEVSSVD